MSRGNQERKPKLKLTKNQATLVSEHMPFAKKLADGYWYNFGRPLNFPMEDVESEAYVGLCLAVKKWDPERSPLTAYIRLIVNNHLKDVHSKREQVAHLPKRDTERNLNAIRATVKSGITNVDRIVEHLGLNKKIVVELLPYITSNNFEDIDGLADSLHSGSHLPEVELESKETKVEIRLAVEQLPKHLKKIVELRFGFTNGSMHTTQEIAKKLRLQVETVRQREAEAMEILETKLKRA